MTEIEKKNKGIVTSLIGCLDELRPADTASYIADNGTWTIVGKPDTFPFAKEYDKAGICELLINFVGSFESFSYRILSMTAEDNRVVVEGESEGVGKNGKTYTNKYLMLYRLENGKVVSAKEFLDQLEVLNYVG